MPAALVALFAGIILAANMGLALASGIACGWQPMPDGSASYECIVQVAPELVHSLKHGDSIPLSVDVPEHVRPISRIRFVVGDGRMPQQTLMKNFKVWPEANKQARDGIVETQFTTGGSDNRYGSPQASNGAVVPLNGYVADTQDALARSLQNGGQAVREAVNQATQDILPPDPGRSMANAVDRASQELGNNLRSASETVREDIRQLFGEQDSNAGGAAILPPHNQSSAASGSPQPPAILPGNGSTPIDGRRRLDQPVTTNQGSDWQSDPSATAQASSPATRTNPVNPSNSFGTQWAGDGMTPQARVGNGAAGGSPLGDRYGSAPSFGRNGSQVLPQNNTQASTNQNDRSGTAGEFQNGNLPAADSRNSAAGDAQSAGAGPSFPPFTPSVGNSQSPITPTPETSSATPEIRRDMLNQPANAAIQGANGLPIGQQPVTPTQVTSQTLPAQAAPAASDFGWNTQPQVQQAGADGGTNSVFPLLLSWVLLSGSGAGNLYLFWSYLDVRNKYRDLVDDASRRISGRRIRD